MKILVTGCKGFIGKNLVARLQNLQTPEGEEYEIFGYDIDTPLSELEVYTKECEAVFHFAGVNRPEKEDEFVKGNTEFTGVLLQKLKENKNKAPVIMTSSIQAVLDNPYGISKKKAEELVSAYGDAEGVRVCIYRLPGVFGKWCRPNYNSVVATFCNNIAKGEDITINSEDTELTLVYIDDVVNELIEALYGRETKNTDFCRVPVTHKVTLGRLARLIYSFKESRGTLEVADMSDPFVKKLYSTYLSYLPKDGFDYQLKMNKDNRGSFTEIIRTADRGQFSVNIIKPGITKGNHWHNTKNEKFLVVSGRVEICFRKVFSDEVITYTVDGDDLRVVDIPTGYTHNIKNISDSDAVVFMWCNEPFDNDNPDTYFLEV